MVYCEPDLAFYLSWVCLIAFPCNLFMAHTSTFPIFWVVNWAWITHKHTPPLPPNTRLKMISHNVVINTIITHCLWYVYPRIIPVVCSQSVFLMRNFNPHKLNWLKSDTEHDSFGCCNNLEKKRDWSTWLTIEKRNERRKKNSWFMPYSDPDEFVINFTALPHTTYQDDKQNCTQLIILCLRLDFLLQYFEFYWKSKMGEKLFSSFRNYFLCRRITVFVSLPSIHLNFTFKT